MRPQRQTRSGRWTLCQPSSSTAVDAFSRVSSVIDIRQSYRSSAAVNGPEFTRKPLGPRAYLNDVTLDLSRAGKPTDKARSRREACRMENNEARPKGGIGQKFPIELAKGPGQACLA